MDKTFTYSARHADRDRYRQAAGFDAAPAASGLNGVKDLFFLIENWIRQGQSQAAVEFLIANGYDQRTALSQVAAVRQALQEGRQQR